MLTFYIIMLLEKVGSVMQQPFHLPVIFAVLDQCSVQHLNKELEHPLAASSQLFPVFVTEQYLH